MDITNQLRLAQTFHIRGFVRQRLEGLQTRLALDEEYWLAIRHPAEVYAAGAALLTSTDPAFAGRLPPERELQWREFRAYVRQAESFYRSAAALPWKSSPLNYYYSFMNLAKALAVARGMLAPVAAHITRALQHGLSARIVPGAPGAPDTWRLTVRDANHIFGLLYQATVAPVAMPATTELDARDLLGYVTAIDWQLRQAGRAATISWHPCYWVILEAGNSAWDLVGVHRGANLNRLPGLDPLYQELTHDSVKQLVRETLGLQSIQARSIRFLQRTTPIVLAPPDRSVQRLEDTLVAAVPNCVFEYLDGTTFHFCFGMPYATGTGSHPMSELAAAYAVMYFLSSLVRYHPDYMDRIAESTDAWLIESFVKSAPLLLLRQMVAASLGYTLIIENV